MIDDEFKERFYKMEEKQDHACQDVHAIKQEVRDINKKLDPIMKLTLRHDAIIKTIARVTAIFLTLGTMVLVALI